jgi:hypothetical protein
VKSGTFEHVGTRQVPVPSSQVSFASQQRWVSSQPVPPEAIQGVTQSPFWQVPAPLSHVVSSATGLFSQVPALHTSVVHSLPSSQLAHSRVPPQPLGMLPHGSPWAAHVVGVHLVVHFPLRQPCEA